MKFIFIFIFSLFCSAQILNAHDLLYSDWGTVSDRWTKTPYHKQELIALLQRYPLSAQIVKDYLERESTSLETLAALIIPAEQSYTHVRWIRQYRKSAPLEVRYQREAKIYLDQSLSVTDALLDLVHELTHYVYKRHDNPYHFEQNVLAALAELIEGPGGEVDAYINECLMVQAIGPQAQSGRRAYCASIRSAGTNRALLVASFYQMDQSGRDHFFSLLDQLLPDKQKWVAVIAQLEALTSTAEGSTFISALAQVPYPIATLLEYQKTKSEICAREEQRLQLLYAQPLQGKQAEAARQAKERYFAFCASLF